MTHASPAFLVALAAWRAAGKPLTGPAFEAYRDASLPPPPRVTAQIVVVSTTGPRRRRSL